LSTKRKDNETIVTALSDIKFADLLAQVRQMRAKAAGRPYRVAILANVVMNPLVPLLEWVLLKEGILPEIKMHAFDNFVQESALLRDVDAAIVFMDAVGLSPNCPDLGICTVEECDQILNGVKSTISQMLDHLSWVPLVIFNNFSALPLEAKSIQVGPLGRISVEMNQFVASRSNLNMVCIDVDKIYANVGIKNAIDFRQFHSARVLHSFEFLKEWVTHAVPAIRSVVGRARKVLVVDCDNTLWGGIIGEDGVDGIRLSETSQDGPFFREAQQIMKSWRMQGVLLAIASKNNAEDVKSVFVEHAGMQLGADDFVALEIGWGEKIESLKRLADRLNLGIDSFVFLDDSPFELERVRAELSGVTCLQVPSDLSNYPGMLREASALFFNLSKSNEDTKRTDMYREELARKKAEIQYRDLDEYLRSLELKVEFTEGARVDVARAAQLSQKTNQFNLTTVRYTQTDIVRMLDDPNMIVATFSVSDRFGDYGTTGMVILQLDRQGSFAKMDTFLMSCRVLGRKVENAAMNWICNRLRKETIRQLDGEYRRTSKNQLVADLLDKFSLQRVSTDGDNVQYRLDLGKYEAASLGSLQVITYDGR
jgi:FkbH-like protein